MTTVLMNSSASLFIKPGNIKNIEFAVKKSTKHFERFQSK